MYATSLVHAVDTSCTPHTVDGIACDVPNSSTVPPPYRSWVLPPYWPGKPIKGPSVYLSILDEYQD